MLINLYSIANHIFNRPGVAGAVLQTLLLPMCQAIGISPFFVQPC